MKHSVIESLESRTLFAGMTILATGRLGGTGGWMQTMANAITAQEGGPSQVPQFLLSVNQVPNSGNLAATISQVAGTGTPQSSSSGEIIILVDYYNVSADASFGSTYIGSTIANFLMNTPVDGINLASLPIHEIGVSRGTAILDGVALALGQSGIWVDQETYLDPDPIAAQQDPPSTIYDNVEFVDNYWRNDGSASQINDGNPVNGAYNLNVYWLDSNDAGYALAHLAPSGYYVGTIDQNATQGGEGPIYSNWYGNTPDMPARNATGWIYSQEVGAARPLSGVWAASGGSGTRTAAGQVGSQWANVSDLAVTSGNTVVAGNSINVSYIHEDRDSADTITFYLDTDRNPYNNAFAATLGSVNLSGPTSTISSSTTLSTNGVAAGTYWLCAKITDAAGNTRYAYEPVTSQLTVRNPSIISGRIFNDLNANGVQDGNEPGLAGCVVYIDVNGSGQYESNDPSTTTDANGNYKFTVTTPGTFSVGYVAPPDTRPTTVGSAPLALAAGQSGAENFGLQSFGSLTGNVFNDAIGSGVRYSGEPGLSGVTVYVDLNNSGQFQAGDPSAVTDANGNYTITGLTPGQPLIVNEVTPAGFRQTTGPADAITIVPGQTASVADFGDTQTSQVSGAVIVTFAAGTPDTGVGGGFTVLLTEQPKHGKAVKFSTVTDAAGNFTFNGLQAGQHYTLQLLKRKGFKLKPHTSASKVLSLASAQLVSNLTFSEVLIATAAHRR